MPGSEEANEEEEVEPQPEREPRESQQIPQVLQSTNQEMDNFFPFPPSTSSTFHSSLCQYYLLSQMGAPDIPSETRETDNDQLKKELEALKPELQLIKSEVSSFSVHTTVQKVWLQLTLPAS